MSFKDFLNEASDKREKTTIENFRKKVAEKLDSVAGNETKERNFGKSIFKEIHKKFIPYKSLDEAGTTIAAHDDDLTEEEKKLADKILLDYINNERLKEFNKKHNIK